MCLARLLPCSALALLLAAPGSAQTRVWTVDKNGPSDFSDIQSAIDASSDGDAILVDGDTFAGFTIQARGVTIVGEAGQTRIRGVVEIEDLPVGTAAVLSNLVLEPVHSKKNGALCAYSNLGSVRLQSCELIGGAARLYCDDDGYPSGDGWLAGARIEDCADVCFTQCSFEGAHGVGGYQNCAVSYYTCGPGAPGIHAEDSSVAVYDCQLQGGRGGDSDDTNENVSAREGGAGARLIRSFMSLSNTLVGGGPGGNITIFASLIVPGPGGAGFDLEDQPSEVQLLDTTIIPGIGGTEPYGSSAPDGAPFIGEGSSVIVQIPGSHREMEMSDHFQYLGTTVLATFRGEVGDQVYLPLDWGTAFHFDPTVKGTWILPQPPTIPPSPIAVIPASGEIQVSIPSAAPTGANWAEVEYRQMYVVSATGDTILGSPTGTLQLRPCPSPSRYCTGAPNSFGPGAIIHLTGSISVSANDAALHASEVPPNQFGLFYYGPNQIQLPWGDGYRCAGGGIHRLGTVSSDFTGYASDQIDYTLPPMNAGGGKVVAGSSWNFQYWYRDPGGPGGTGFNASDALAVTFCP